MLFEFPDRLFSLDELWSRFACLLHHLKVQFGQESPVVGELSAHRHVLLHDDGVGGGQPLWVSRYFFEDLRIAGDQVIQTMLSS